MTGKLRQLGVAAALAAIVFASSVAPASAALSTIGVTFCWGKTTFGSTGCNSRWPTRRLGLDGNATSGIVTGNTVPGDYVYSNNGATMTITFLNHSPTIARVVYTGRNYSGAPGQLFSRHDDPGQDHRSGLGWGLVRLRTALAG